MKKLAVFAVAAVLAASAFGANDVQWIGNSETTFNGQVGSSASTLNLDSISSLLLGGSIQSWCNGYDDAQAEGNSAFLNWKIDNADSYTAVSLPWSAWDDTTSLNSFAGSTSIDVSAYAGDGLTHTIEVYYSRPTSHENWQDASQDRNIWEGQVYEVNSPNYKASFTVSASPAVPEPATMSLLGLGALAMVLRRKLRK